MFILGVVVGPALGLAAGHALYQRRAVGPAVAAALILLAYVVLVAARFLDQELRVGVAMGLGLGLLLAVSPWGVSEHALD